MKKWNKFSRKKRLMLFNLQIFTKFSLLHKVSKVVNLLFYVWAHWQNVADINSLNSTVFKFNIFYLKAFSINFNLCLISLVNSWVSSSSFELNGLLVVYVLRWLIFSNTWHVLNITIYYKKNLTKIDISKTFCEEMERQLVSVL